MNIKQALLILFFILLLIFPLGCVTTDSYRTARLDTEKSCNLSPNEKCEGAAIIRDAENEFILGFVEIDDQGFFHDRRQIDYFFEQIDFSKKTHAIIHIHGWKHNASEGDKDILSFKRRLSWASARHPNHNVVGLYIGWRGESLKLPVLKNLTFWNRKAVSEEIGRNSLVELLLKFENEIREGNKENYLLTVGHSFGGSALYNALSHVLIERLLTVKGGENVQGFGDMVVLINPAIEAMRHTSLKNASELHSRDVKFEPNQPPRLLVVTSETDFATKTAFPIGRLFSTFTEQHKVVKEPHRQNCRLYAL